MKRRLLTLAFICLTISVFGQNFEGKIIYENSYKSKMPGVPDAQFNTMMGTIQEYFVKEGNYKHVSNGTLFQWLLYLNKDNKLYTKMANSETVLWNDGNVNNDSIISYKINKGVTEVLGYKCDELILTCKSGVQKYYFNSQLGVDKSLYADHHFGNWYEFLKHANALPLKIVMENDQFILESIATEVKAMKIDDKEFRLAENTKTEKSPY